MPSISSNGAVIASRLAAIVVAALAAGALLVTGLLTQVHDALVIMGFDPDRAQLLTALVAGAIAAAASALVANRRLVATAAGLLAALALFAGTFSDETRAALASSGDQGHFDPLGWAASGLTLAIVALAAAWAAAIVAGEVRANLAGAGSAVVGVLRGRTIHGVAAGRPVLVVALAVALGVSIPIFGDMVNFSPDSHMRAGGPAQVGLVDTGGSGTDAGAAGGANGAGAGNGGSGTDAGASADPQGGAGDFAAPSLLPGILPPEVSGAAATSTARPWLSSRPTGAGMIVKTRLAPPWTGGADPYATLSIYLPPGYNQSTQRYPVFYEVPWSLESWQEGVGITGMLDNLITSGRLPPVIVVFAGHNGAPIPDSECVDSADGRQQLETYLSQTVVAYTDQNFRTIATPAARALFGFSQGGYCAPMLLLRHPDVFGEAVAFSGYYRAGLRTSQTVNAWRPFGSDPQMIADHSPLLLASTLPSAVRSRLFLVVSGDVGEPIYGPQYASFAAALRQNGYPFLLLPTRLGHSWAGCRATLPFGLEAVAGRWTALGLFNAA